MGHRTTSGRVSEELTGLDGGPLSRASLTQSITSAEDALDPGVADQPLGAGADLAPAEGGTRGPQGAHATVPVRPATVADSLHAALPADMPTELPITAGG